MLLKDCWQAQATTITVKKFLRCAWHLLLFMYQNIPFLTEKFRIWVSTRLQIVIEGLPKTEFCDLNTNPRFFSDFANYFLHANKMTRAVEPLTTSSRPNSLPVSRDMNFRLFEYFWQQKTNLLNISRDSICDSQIKTLWAIEMRKNKIRFIGTFIYDLIYLQITGICNILQ